MLIVNNLTKQYKSTKALKSVNLQLDGSQIVGLVGPNGAGKTTLLKCITNLTARYDGEILKKNNTSIGLVLDNLAAYQSRTLHFNLKYFRLAKGLKTYDHSLKILKQLKFDTNLLNDKLSTFSYGMNQKVITAISLMSDPDIILLDEPFRGLDFETVEIFKELLINQKQRGKLIIYSSHNIEDVEAICDKVIVIANGKLLDVIDSQTISKFKRISFSTSDNELALEILEVLKPKYADNTIKIIIREEQWNEVHKVLINNDIEVFDIEKNSYLLSKILNLLGSEKNV